MDVHLWPGERGQAHDGTAAKQVEVQVHGL